MDRRWMWYETVFRTLKDDLREFLQENGIRYELSGCGPGWHFEVFCSAEEESYVDVFLDNHTITEVNA